MARNEELRKQAEARLANETSLASVKAAEASKEHVKEESTELTLLLSQQKQVSDLVAYDEKQLSQIMHGQEEYEASNLAQVQAEQDKIQESVNQAHSELLVR